MKINRSASSSPGGQRGGGRSPLEPDSPKGAACIGARHFAWFVIVALVPVAMAALKFGRGFLVQFFISPFQFFILVPWLLAFFSLKTGIMPLRSSGPILRDENPRHFWISVAFYVLMGAVSFAFNLCVSWLVLARSR